MREFGILTLSRFPEIFETLNTSLVNLETNSNKKVVVTSGDAFKELILLDKYKEWEIIKGDEPFNFSRNANLGLSALRGMDILLTNDDVSFTNAITPVMDIVDSDPTIGIVSPQIDGGVGNILQSLKLTKIATDYIESQKRLAFICVYIRKEVLEKVGLFDERTFGSNNTIEYGCEDADFCHRAQQEGFKLVVTPKMVVKHGFEQYEYSSSFLQIMTPEERNASMFKMRERLTEKYN